MKMTSRLIRILLSRQQYYIVIFIIIASLISFNISTNAPSSTPTPCIMPIPEYNALYAFYNSTNGIEWSTVCKKSWIFSLTNPDYSAPCNGWYGVYCNNQCQVIELNLQSCQLTGFITTQLGIMTSMIELYLQSNELACSIPSELGYMTKLTSLYLYSNSLTGTIPSQLGYMTKMTNLRLFSNYLTGTIPSQMGSMKSMQYLYLEDNGLTGTIPSEISFMTSTLCLVLQSNKLSGTIPPQLGSMTSITELFLYSNSLVGTIPPQLGSMTNIKYLFLYDNYLTGTIPSELGYMTKMMQFMLFSNSLTGNIPSELGLMTGLYELILSNNQLSGSLSIQFNNMPLMQNLDLSSNSLTGTLPASLGSIPNLKYLILNNNSFTGPIPNELGQCIYLNYICLQYNNLMGLVPSSIFILPRLLSINLAYNQLLSGNLSSLFTETTASKYLKYIILASMSLAGSLPESLFSLSNLETLVLSSNCITGTLTSAICTSNISNLILDGIGVGPSCNYNNKKTSFYGMIPTCILTMSSLNTLHLAGNGLTGSLDDISLNSNLTNLNLANNRLTGNIPLSIQTHFFNNLDLSSNQLSGTLIESYELSNSIILKVNRLSGKWPIGFTMTNSTINILEGNLFGCPLLHNDVNSKIISCGSSNLDYPMIQWLVLFVIVLILVLYLPYSNLSLAKRLKNSIMNWWQSFSQCLSLIQNDSNELYHTKNTIRYAENACSIVIIVAPLYIIIAMMSYIILKLQELEHFKSLYYVQYLYTATSAYLVGVTPTILIWLYLAISGTIVVILSVATRLDYFEVKSKFNQDFIHRIDTNDESTEIYYQDYIKSMIIRVVVTVVVCALAIGINYGFVQIIYFGKPSHLSTINFAFALIKSLLSTTVVPFSTKLLPKTSRQSHIILMTIVVNVIGPAIATILSSPLCLFYYFKKNTLSVSYQYLQETCDGGSFSFCYPIRQTSSSTITPQWFYSYECSSSYLTSFLPNFIYLYIINGIVFPTLNLLAMFMLSSRGETRTIHHHYMPKFLSSVLQFIYDKLSAGKIYYIRDTSIVAQLVTVISPITSSSSTSTTTITSLELSTLDQDIYKKRIESSSSLSITNENIELSAKHNTAEKYYSIVVSKLMPDLCVDITQLLTFGLASPVLALMVSYSIIINTMLLRLALGRYMSIVSKTIGSRACFEKLELAFENEWRCLPSTWWLISVFIGLFWGLFVYDMIGDKDHKGGILAATLMSIWFPFTFVSLQWLLSVTTDSNSNNRIQKFSSNVHFFIWKYILNLERSIDICGVSSKTSFDTKTSRITDTETVISSL